MDAALVAGGGALIGWSVLASPPAAATVAGIVAVGLGCILPERAGWRALAGRRRERRRAALLAGDVPLRVDDPALGRLVAGYESLGASPAAAAAAPRGPARGGLVAVRPGACDR